MTKFRILALSNVDLGVQYIDTIQENNNEKINVSRCISYTSNSFKLFTRI